MTPAEVIREARNVLFESGWMQGDFTLYDDETGNRIKGAPVCAYGALQAAAETGTLEAANILFQALPPGWHNIADFNDAPDRSFDEVVDLFDRAEKIAEATS